MGSNLVFPPLPVVATAILHESGKGVVVLVPFNADPQPSSKGKSALLATARLPVALQGGGTATVALNVTAPIAMLGAAAQASAATLRQAAEHEEAREALVRAAAVLGIPVPSIGK